MTSSEKRRVFQALLEARIQMEEELHAISNNIPHWNTGNRKSALEHTIAVMISNEPTNKELLEEPLDILKPTLLELVLTNLKHDTKDFTAREQIKADTTFVSLKGKLQTLISSEDTPEKTMEIESTTAKWRN